MSDEKWCHISSAENANTARETANRDTHTIYRCGTRARHITRAKTDMARFVVIPRIRVRGVHRFPDRR